MAEIVTESYGTTGADWLYRGYCGQGNVVELLDSLSGRTAVICGGAQGVFQEVAPYEKADVVIFAANDVGMYLPRLDHWVSLHTPRLDHWVAVRRDQSGAPMGNMDFRVHDAGLHGVRDWYQWKNLRPVMALSGMFAAQVAWLMGCAKIILCGCPNDATPRFFETQARSRDAYVNVQRQIKDEMAFKPDFKAAIRSCSGWSREFFGAP